MKHTNVEQLVESAIRRERLLRWAELVRQSRVRLSLFHNLEHWNKAQLSGYLAAALPHSALSIAARDPVFHSQGLSETYSILDVLKFFSLTQEQLHEFSCDCGGAIDNSVMADRIEKMA